MHFVHCLAFDGLVQLVVAPVVAHLGVHHVLTDGGEFVRQELIEDGQQLRVALHVRPPMFEVSTIRGRCEGRPSTCIRCTGCHPKRDDGRFELVDMGVGPQPQHATHEHHHHSHAQVREDRPQGTDLARRKGKKRATSGTSPMADTTLGAAFLLCSARFGTMVATIRPGWSPTQSPWQLLHDDSPRCSDDPLLERCSRRVKEAGVGCARHVACSLI